MEKALRAMRLGQDLARGHPRQSSAERAGALAPIADGLPALRGKQLHPRLQQSARKIVTARLGVTGPVDEEAGARGLRVVPEAGARVLRQPRRTRLRVAEEGLGASEKQPGLLLEIGADGLLGERTGQLALRAVQACREAERRLGRSGARSEQLGALGTLRQAGEDVSACGRHPSLAGTTWDGAAVPIPW